MICTTVEFDTDSDETQVVWGSPEQTPKSENIPHSCEIVELVVFGLNREDSNELNDLFRIQGEFVMDWQSYNNDHKTYRKNRQTQMRLYVLFGSTKDGVLNLHIRRHLYYVVTNLTRVRHHHQLRVVSKRKKKSTSHLTVLLVSVILILTS
eukprot:UN02627